MSKAAPVMERPGRVSSIGLALPAPRVSAAIGMIAVLVGADFSSDAVAQAAKGTERSMTNVVIKIDGTQVTAAIDDNAAARDFLAMLPMTLTLEDYNNTEKISDLPGRLSTDGAPRGHDPSVGDITYFAPWGNLAIFYRDFGYSTGLVRLGAIESGIDLLEKPGPLKVTVERAD